MIATPHMVAGAAGATKARSTTGAVAIGTLTHLVLDGVPHRDYRMDTFGGLALIADTTIGTLVVWRLSKGSKVLLAGALGGMLPDLLRLIERALHINLTTWAHNTIHTPSRPSPWRSAAAQGLVAGAAALALRRLGEPRRTSAKLQLSTLRRRLSAAPGSGKAPRLASHRPG